VRELLVGGRWPLPLVEGGAGGHFAHIDREASKMNEACFMHIIRDFPQGLSVVEYFGGVGIFATIVQETLRPSAHTIYDIDPDCVRQLHSAFDGRATVGIGDAKELMGTVDADMVVLDFPTMNVRFFERDWPVAKVMQRPKAPKYLIWSDTALRRIGWFRHLYSDFFNEPVVSYGDYIRCFNKLLWSHYRYTITRVSRHMHAYYLAQPMHSMLPPAVVSLRPW
jgi:hypothetical protein